MVTSRVDSVREEGSMNRTVHFSRGITRLSYTGYWDRYDKEKKTALFSDRSLYRPGQTVYFSGIRYVNNTEESRVIPREKCTVRFIDPSSRTLVFMPDTVWFTVELPGFPSMSISTT